MQHTEIAGHRTHEDRRVRRSRRLLGDALLALLEDRDLSAITVRSLTDKADVGYMTFYRHYDSIDALLIDRIHALIEEDISQVIAECDRQGMLVVEHVMRFAHLYRTLIFSPSAARARQRLERLMADIYEPFIPPDPLMPRDLRARQLAAAIITLIAWWFEEGRSLPHDTIARLYEQTIVTGGVVIDRPQAPHTGS